MSGDERRQPCPSPGASGGVIRQKVRRPTHYVRLPMHNVSHPIQNVDSPTRSVSLPMHNYRHPMHYVRRPIHFIAIRWGFCAFAGTKCPVLGKSVQKRDTERNAACRGRGLALRCHRLRRAGGTGGVRRKGCVSPVCCAAITRRGRRSAPVPILRGSRSDRMRVAWDLSHGVGMAKEMSRVSDGCVVGFGT